MKPVMKRHLCWDPIPNTSAFVASLLKEQVGSATSLRHPWSLAYSLENLS